MCCCPENCLSFRTRSWCPCLVKPPRPLSELRHASQAPARGPGGVAVAQTASAGMADGIGGQGSRQVEAEPARPAGGAICLHGSAGGSDRAGDSVKYPWADPPKTGAVTSGSSAGSAPTLDKALPFSGAKTTPSAWVELVCGTRLGFTKKVLWGRRV